MTTITTLDGREVVRMRDRDGVVGAEQIRRADRSPLVPVGDTVLSQRYLWERDGRRVVPEAYRVDRQSGATESYVLR